MEDNFYRLKDQTEHYITDSNKTISLRWTALQHNRPSGT